MTGEEIRAAAVMVLHHQLDAMRDLSDLCVDSVQGKKVPVGLGALVYAACASAMALDEEHKAIMLETFKLLIEFASEADSPIANNAPGGEA